jgi:DNA-binding transcriptional ArsR family regulator
MIERLRKELQDRLDQLLSEADRLRQAIAALDPRSRPSARVTEAPARPRTPRSAAASAAPAPAASRTRTAPGATRKQVLEALAGGQAMTAGEVAAATGLARGTVSTTLSKLAKSGEVTKAERGYQLL